ncbi:unnamed protein product, partial [Porites lobata]
ESELILNRAGRIGILREDEKEALTICLKHRKHLTTDWPGQIFVEFKEIVPIGAAICTSCRLEHYKKREKSDFDVHLDEGMEQEAGVQSSSGQSFVTTPGGNEEVSQISVPEEEVSIWCDEKEIQNERRQALNDALGNLTSGRFSPILSTLNASWDDISSTQQKYYIRKAREAVAATLSVISPGQEKRPVEMYPK